MLYFILLAICIMDFLCEKREVSEKQEAQEYYQERTIKQRSWSIPWYTSGFL